jgi:hypothetical protein
MGPVRFGIISWFGIMRIEQLASRQQDMFSARLAESGKNGDA